MQMTKTRTSRHVVVRESKALPKPHEQGLVLTDMSFKPIACDRGAVAILNGKNGARIDSPLRKEILDLISAKSLEDLSAEKITFRVGNSQYNCRAYLMEPENGAPAMVALHIESVSAVNDAIGAVAAKYGLTGREQEALRGISMGLSSKELAERMTISPNTVKVFLRLIMIKMGVATRGGIVAQILQTQSTLDNREERAMIAGA